jgi:hypothetical protein
VSDITTVITNFKRPKMLWRCYQSCYRKSKNIVIVSYGVNKEVVEVLKRIGDGATIISRKEDLGNNNQWIEGVQAAKTNFIHILHDDDLLLSSYDGIILKSDFVMWDARKLKHRITGKYYRGFWGQEGVRDTSELIKQFDVQSYSPSPAMGCFPKDFVLKTLDEASTFGPEFYSRKNMLIGNDYLLWLRAAEAFSSFMVYRRGMVAFGHHPNSETIRHVSQGSEKLLKIYGNVKNYFFKKPIVW